MEVVVVFSRHINQDRQQFICDAHGSSRHVHYTQLNIANNVCTFIRSATYIAASKEIKKITYLSFFGKWWQKQ